MFRTTSKNSKSANEEVGKIHEGQYEMISGFKEQHCAALNRLHGNDQDEGCNAGVRRLRRKRTLVLMGLLKLWLYLVFACET